MRRIITLFFLVGLIMPVSAIVVQDYVAAEAAPSDLDWGYVYNYKGSSSVAVGGGWLLTAGHVADDGGSGSLDIDGTIYNQQEVFSHDEADLALVRFDKAFPGYYPLYTGTLFNTPRLDVLMVGFGTKGTVSNNYWTALGTGRGTKRWGSQEIDRTLPKILPGNDYVNPTSNFGFEMDFNLGSTANEAGAGVGDSGSGVFYNDGGIWKLAGINIALVGGVGGQYTGTYANGMSYYADWIAAAIPEPAVLELMGFATIGLFLARTKRRRKLAGRSLFPIRGDEPMCNIFSAMEEGEYNSRSGGLNTGALWRFIAAAFQRSTVRREGAGERLNIVLMESLDIFLERISWDRIVISVKSARTKPLRSLKIRTVKSLDAFLDIISWDQMISLFRRWK